MTTLDSTPIVMASTISTELLELAAQLATQNPLPAQLAEDVAPLTANLLKRRTA